MKVAYLLNWRFGASSGVYQKVMSQARAWDEAGVETGVFVATTPPAVADWEQSGLTRGITTFTSGAQSLAVQPRLLGMVSRWSPDITYVRMSPRLFAALPRLRRLRHVIEVQTDDVAEARLLALPSRMANLATRRALFGGAAGLVFVSGELAASPHFAFASSNRIVIGNGADLRRIPPLPPAEADQIRLFFMEHSQAPWHGTDQVYALAEHRPHWQFDVVGPSADPMVPLPPNVHLHGRLTSDAFVEVLRNSTIALSTLSLYAKDMSEASPLKSRDYLARGVPVVGGYLDTDLPGDAEFYLRVPNRPGGIISALPQVDAFVERWRGRRIPRDLLASLDVAAKERTRLDFLRACIGSGG
jgi:hypothetical protein